MHRNRLADGRLRRVPATPQKVPLVAATSSELLPASTANLAAALVSPNRTWTLCSRLREVEAWILEDFLCFGPTSTIKVP